MAPGNLLLAPAGSGKTAFVISEVLKTKFIKPWNAVWILVPTDTQVTAFRDRLLDAYIQDRRENAYFGVEFYTFYTLYNHLLDHMHIPQRQIQPTSVYRILHYLITELDQQGKLPYFHPIIEKAGLIGLIHRFINELKQGRVRAERFSSYATTPKERDLAFIYSTYQQFLIDHQLVDREGAGWLALAELEDHAKIYKHIFEQVGILIVDGYQQFSPLQAELLGALASHIRKSWLTLTYDPQRINGIHRSFDRTLRRLNHYHVWQEQYLHEHKTFKPHINRRPQLSHLEQHLLSVQPTPMPAEGSIRFIEAPDMEQECRAVLRQVKTLLLNNVPAEQIVVTALDLEPYSEHLRTAAIAYDLPVVFREAPPLYKNPAVVAVLALVDLSSAAVDYRRQSVLDILRSPYFDFSVLGLSEADVDTLEQLSLQYNIVRSKADWLDAFEQALKAPSRVDDESDEIKTIGVDLTLLEKLKRFFDFVEPSPKATVRDYVAWIESLLGADVRYVREAQSETPDGETVATEPPQHLQFYKQVRQSDGVEQQLLVVRDIYALSGMRRCLVEMLTAADLLMAQSDGKIDGSISWERFRADWQLAIEQFKQEPIGGKYRVGRVLIANASEVRGLPHPHVFIMGLSEGIFPAPNREDVLYSDQERLRLRNATDIEMQTTIERIDDNATFYELCAMTLQTLTLSRPTLDERANLWAESVLWRAVQEILLQGEVIRYRAGQPLTLQDVADVRELSVALAAEMRQTTALNETITEIHEWLLSQANTHQPWRHVLHGRRIESQRMDGRQGFDSYSGILKTALYPQSAVEQLRTVWSASRLNDYGYCPFRFFAKRVLKLEALEEPVEGYDAAQLGSVQHEVLERSYQQFQLERLAITPENQKVALEIFSEIAADTLANAPQRFGFKTGLWEQEKGEIYSRLEKLIKVDFSTDKLNPFIIPPRSRSSRVIAELVAKINQPRYVWSVERQFMYRDDTNGFEATGYIDRMDIVGDHLFVIDYKSGTSTPTNDDMENGRNFQMMLYLLAAQQIATEANLKVGGGFFWSIRSRRAQGQILGDDMLIVEAQKIAYEYIDQIQAGDFRVEEKKLEDGKCFKYCEFYQLCRRASTRVFAG